MIEKIADLLQRTDNFDATKLDRFFLENSLKKSMARGGFKTVAAYCVALIQNSSERTDFIASLQISYSEFFRNPLTFAVLERIVLPALALKKNNREIRVWSAACAGGQEAYSLAILLEELRNGHTNRFKYRIFATDQSATQVNEARQGRYAAVALNNMTLLRSNQWFTRKDDVYTVKPALKKNIDFSTFDLTGKELTCPANSIFGDFDLVVCANVLFYYTEENRRIILQKSLNCLADSGYLMVGEAERDIVVRENYREIFPQAAIFQKLPLGNTMKQRGTP